MKNLGRYSDALDIPRKQDVDAVRNEIPTKTSQLVNDSKFATTTYVDNAIPSAITNAQIDDICGGSVTIANGVSF